MNFAVFKENPNNQEIYMLAQKVQHIKHSNTHHPAHPHTSWMFAIHKFLQAVEFSTPRGTPTRHSGIQRTLSRQLVAMRHLILATHDSSLAGMVDNNKNMGRSQSTQIHATANNKWKQSIDSVCVRFRAWMGTGDRGVS